jgi:Protein of unknown function (DUF4232)
MAAARLQHRHTRHAALLAVASAALLTTAACAGAAAGTAPSHVGAAPVADASNITVGTPAAPAIAPTTPATPATTAARTAPGSAAPVVAHRPQSPARSGKAAGTNSSTPACGNSDLAMDLGYGTQSQPVQDASVVFTNVSGRTCTLQGYPGAAIVVDGRTVDATRVLNVDRGDQPPLSSPPLVTLAPGASGYAVYQWVLGTGPNCYPTGTGELEATAPNTMFTKVLSTAAAVGQGGICSGFEISPVMLGYFGVPVGVPARN